MHPNSWYNFLKKIGVYLPMVKRVILLVLFMLTLSSTVFAYEPNPKEWTWRFSSDKQSVYSYNAPPELLNIDADRYYVEFTGHVLVILPYDPNYSRYEAKIKVGIKAKEKQMWIAYLQQIAYDKDGNIIEKEPDPESEKWHSVLHSTSEELYGLALFQAFVEYGKAGAYSGEKK